MKTQNALSLVAVTAASATVSWIFMAETVVGQSSSTARDESADPIDTSSVAERPIDTIPGLGISDAAASRDTAISLWENFQRETLTKQCMAKSDFAYEVDLRHSPAELVEAAEYLGESVEVPATLTPDPNRNYVQALTQAQLEEYARALYGQGSGERGNETNSGCINESWGQVGSVWEIREYRAGLLSRERDLRKSDEMKPVRDAYRKCASEFGVEDVESTVELERAVADPRLLGAVVDKCEGPYLTSLGDAMIQVEQDFINENLILTRQRDVYTDVRNRLLGDDAFLRAIGVPE